MTWLFSFEENHSITSFESWIVAIQKSPSPIGHDRRDIFCIVKNGHVRCYIQSSEFETADRLGLQNLTNKRFTTIQKAAQKEVKKFKRLKSKVKRVLKLDNEHLSKLYQEYFGSYGRVLVFFEITQPEYIAPLERKLRMMLSSNGLNGSALEGAVSLLTTPTKIDITKKEDIDFLKIAAAKNNSSEKILLHADKYPHLFANAVDEKSVEEFLQAKLTEEKKNPNDLKKMISSLKNKKHAIEIRQKELVRQMQKSATDIFQLSELLKKLAVYRLDLKLEWAGAEFSFREGYKEIAKRLGIEVEDLKQGYKMSDITNGLTSKTVVSPQTVSTRKKDYCFWLDGKQLKFFEGETALKIAEETLPKAPPTNVLHGTIAHPGKVTGRVRIVQVEDFVKLREDIKNFKEKEILVTSMTQPSMVVMVKKAAAIVTNEGGITSHAAVLAREFNIPCIVGTRNATIILKTGDLIEVDATKGTIQIVETKD